MTDSKEIQADTPRRRARLIDVANTAGVSKSTAAQALSGTGGRNVRVSEGTIDRIRAVAKQMNYRPHQRAQALASGRAGAIGLLYGRSSPFSSGIYGRLIGKLAQMTTQAHRDFVLIPAIGDHEVWGEKLGDQRFDGCLVVDPMPKGLDLVLRDLPLPTVLLNLDSELSLPRLLFDDLQGANLATQHLLELGHRRITFIRERKRETEHYSVNLRLKGFEKAMGRSGLGEHSDVVLAKQLGVLFDRIVNNPRKAPTALICYTTATAVMAIREAYARNIQIPDQLSIIAFGSLIRGADTITPRLTYVRLPVDDMVRTGTRYLLEMIAGQRQLSQSPPLTVRLSERLIVRESTAPPAI